MNLDIIYDWIKTQFYEHPNYDEILEYLEKIIAIHKGETNIHLIINDIASSDLWKFRTIGTKDGCIPKYWNPIEDTYLDFVNLQQSLGYLVNTYEKATSYPPLDIILVILHAKSKGYQ